MWWVTHTLHNDMWGGGYTFEIRVQTTLVTYETFITFLSNVTIRFTCFEGIQISMSETAERFINCINVTVSFCRSIRSVHYVFKLSDAITLKGFCKRSRSSDQSPTRGPVTTDNSYSQTSSLWWNSVSRSFMRPKCHSALSQVIRLFDGMSTIPHTLVCTTDTIANQSWSIMKTQRLLTDLKLKF